MYYLDNAATTQPKPEVITVMNDYLKNKWYNPSSLYSDAKKIKSELDGASKIISDFINAKPNEIYYTSGGSESNNWVLQGFINKCHIDNVVPAIITTTIEHNSIRLYLNDYCTKDKSYVRIVNVDEYGVLKLKELESALKYFKQRIRHENNIYAGSIKLRILVSIQFANNEIGTIQDIKTISKIAHKYGALFHTDAVQAFGTIPIDVDDLGVDFMSVSGHKFGASKGIGFLYIRNEYEKFLTPLIYGTQNNGMRGGTENVAAIMGMAKAIEDKSVSLDIAELARNECLDILNRYGIKYKLNGDRYNRLPNNLNITLDYNLTGEALIYLLDTCGYKISSGSACDSHSNQPSFVLKAIGLTDSEAMRTIRITTHTIGYFPYFEKFVKNLTKEIQVFIGGDDHVQNLE